MKAGEPTRIAWDGTGGAYAAIRDAVDPAPDGRPGFHAACMMTAGEPGAARLWDGQDWLPVELGQVVVIGRGGWIWVEWPGVAT